MKTLAQASLFIVFSIVAAVVAVIVWVAVDVAQRAMAALDAIGPGLFIAGVLVVAGAGAFVMIGGAVAVVRAVNLKSRQVHHHDGLYPVLYHRQDGRAAYYNPNSEHAQALAVMHAAGRATSASVGRVLDWQPTAAPVPSGPAAQSLTPADVVDVDPRTAPHWLLIGSTGSGKTSASYRILGDLVRRHPAEVVICEPGGVNWSGQATATNTAEIARTIAGVNVELERRQSLLRQADVDHVQDLAQPLPYLVVVCEETESVLDDLKLTDRATRDATVIALRSIARLGRKCGICLVAVTQSGSLDVFDAHVRRNVSNVLLFRSEHTVSEQWRLPGVRLQDLQPGQAYSVRHGAVVNFPMTARPVLQLAQPADGIPVADWPVPRTGIPAEVPGTAPSDGGIPVFDGTDRTAYTTAQVEHIHRLYAQLGSVKAVERELYGQDGGYWFYRVREVLS